MSKQTEAAKDYTYFHERLDALGWTEELNVVRFPATVAGDGKEHLYRLFDADEEGNLVINYYAENGSKAEFKRATSNVSKPYQVLRYVTPRVRPDGTVEKYKHPSGTGTLPWFAPNVIDAFNAQRELDVLVMIEGVIKSYAGFVGGAYTVGLPGIHNIKDKGTGTLFPSLLRVLRTCKPKDVVFLQDGDAVELRGKDLENAAADLYTRPNSFFTSARNMGEALKDHARSIGFTAHYMHVCSGNVRVDEKTEPPKGYDDLVLAVEADLVRKAGEPLLPVKGQQPVPVSAERQAELHMQARAEVVKDLLTLSGPQKWFERRPLDRPDKLRDYFHLRSADSFYAAHQERIGPKEFIYDGTKYQWDEGEKALKVKVPSVAKNYVRVGTVYYKYSKRRNPHTKKLEELLVKWEKGAINDDHSRHFIDHIQKYDMFTNWPDHVAHQDVMDNCLNAYGRFMHMPDFDADEPVATIGFLSHVFGTGTIEVPHPKRPGEMMKVNELDLGLDYLKLLYERPTQMLPILCLVSKERNTGKTTFFNYLKHLFGVNCTQIGAKDLESDFNYHYASKLLAIIDEALISKDESVEKLKHLSTSKNITVNNKGVTQYEQPFFGKFLLASNNIRKFIKTDDDEVRFWIRKLPRIPADKLDLKVEDKMVDEIPAMLAYLNRRPFATEEMFRSWFHPPLMVTEALHDVRKHSMNGAQREIEGWLKGIFYATRDEEILMSAKDLKREVFRTQSTVNERYINEVVKELMEVSRWKKDGKSSTRTYSYWRVVETHRDALNGPGTKLEEFKVSVPERPFVFRREDLIDDATWALLKPEAGSSGHAVVQEEEQLDDLPF